MMRRGQTPRANTNPGQARVAAKLGRSQSATNDLAKEEVASERGYKKGVNRYNKIFI
jgi:hypothetical protein